jgi:hypothetical protein
LHSYNNHRGHTALGGHPPASRVTNLSGQYKPGFAALIGDLGRDAILILKEGMFSLDKSA